jgi:hypothetical protein
VRFTTSGGLKTVKQLSRIRTTKTKDYELSVSTLFEFEKPNSCGYRMYPHLLPVFVAS